MNLILLTDMSLLMTVHSDMIVLILPSLGVTYNIGCYMEELKYLTLDNNSPGFMTCPSMVLFS